MTPARSPAFAGRSGPGRSSHGVCTGRTAAPAGLFVCSVRVRGCWRVFCQRSAGAGLAGVGGVRSVSDRLQGSGPTGRSPGANSKHNGITEHNLQLSEAKAIH